MNKSLRRRLVLFFGLVLMTGFLMTGKFLTTSVASTSRPTEATPNKTTLTPAASVSSKVSIPPSEEDIRDIRQPWHIPCPWPWVAAAAGVFILGTGGFLIWRRLRHQRSRVSPTPYQLAREALARARLIMNSDYAREYCFMVSQLLRDYIEVQFQLRAPRLTTEEFLRDLVQSPQPALAPHRAPLADLLQLCDLAKFAGWRCSLHDLEAINACASSFLEQTGMDRLPSAAKPARIESRRQVEATSANRLINNAT